MEEFKLTEDDQYAIEIAIHSARRLLRLPSIEPQQVIGLGNALFALERMPLVTEGAYCEFGIVYESGTEDLREMRYIDFSISDSTFEITKGGSVYDRSIGSDSFSDSGWLIELSGYSERKCELFTLNESISEYLNLGAEIKVSDDSEIEYDELDEQ